MRIGRYEIERELGRGAMGVVYLARDPRVRRQVAIKTYVIPEGLPADQQDEFRERFFREAQAAGALNHPAIVTIYDAGDDADSRIPFIAMEYVKGRSLADLIAASGALAPDVAFDQAEAVAEALHEAHAAGIVHRDIKPANLLIPEGRTSVKVADFGVARMATSELTRTGISLGSPSYMSPEQVRGQPADGRSDLFSLAVVLYESLCGERPFKGNDITALAYAVAHTNPAPVSTKRPGLPEGIDAFFDRALAKDPAKRFPDGLAFRDALRVLRRGESLAASSTLVLATADDDADLGAGVGSQSSTLQVVTDTGPAVESPEPARAEAPGADSGSAPEPTATAAKPLAASSRQSQETQASTPRATARQPGASGPGSSGGSNASASRGSQPASPKTRPAASMLREPIVVTAGGWWTNTNADPDHFRRKGGTQTLSGPWKLGLAAAAVLLLALVIGIWASAAHQAVLIVDGQNGFEDAHLVILVDGDAVFSRTLSADKKEASFMGRRLFDYGSEEFGGTIRLAPGEHEIVAEVLPEGEDEPYRDVTKVDLNAGDRRRLRIRTGKALGRPLAIHLD